MGRAKENFNDVNFKDESGDFVPFGTRFDVLRNIFWNIMDGHALVRESVHCRYSIEARGKRCYLVEEYKTGGISGRYEILNCTYGELKCRINRKLLICRHSLSLADGLRKPHGAMISSMR